MYETKLLIDALAKRSLTFVLEGGEGGPSLNGKTDLTNFWLVPPVRIPLQGSENTFRQSS